MSVSTDGKICFGSLFEEGFEFPWDKYKDNPGDIEDWWIYEVLGYKNPFEIYDENGEYINGERPDENRVDEYYKCRREFLMGNQVPVELVNCCSCDCPIYIISIPGSKQRCSRGYPIEIDFEKMFVSDEQKKALIEFIETYITTTDYEEPKWYLASLWC
jgi:hypothetical protein